MTTPMHRIIDIETQEVTDVEFTAKEIESYAAEEAARVQAANDKATAKAALLDRLGMTAEEAKLLLS